MPVKLIVLSANTINGNVESSLGVFASLEFPTPGESYNTTDDHAD